MGFRNQVLYFITDVFTLILILIFAAIETVVLLIPAFIVGIITDKWPKWGYRITLRLWNKLPD